MRHLFKTLFTGDLVVTEVLHSSMDVISSVIVMVLVLFAGIILAFFVVFQVRLFSFSGIAIDPAGSFWQFLLSCKQTEVLLLRVLNFPAVDGPFLDDSFLIM